MFVRTASARDLPAVRALLVETWHDTYDAIYGVEEVKRITDDWHSIAALGERLDRPQSEFLVADDGEAIAGMTFAATVDEGETVLLYQLYVRPALQGRGIGSMLLDEIGGCFPGAGTVRLEVEQANLRAVRFYVSQGFSQVTEKDGPEGTGTRIATYERPIVWAD